MERVMGHAGRYDDVAIAALTETCAEAVVVVVMGGTKGHGFSVSALDGFVGHVHQALPAILRMVADAIEQGAPPDGVRVTLRDESPGSAGKA